jgi:hypothetical protein
MTEDKQDKKLDDATKAFEEAERDFMVNNSKEEKSNMEKKIKNDEKTGKEKDSKKEKINLSIAIGAAVLFCFSMILFFMH